jgi:hypothetical protein
MLGAEISADRPMVQRTGVADHAASARSRNCPWNRQKAPAGTRGGRASSGAPPRMAGAGYEPVETNVPGRCAPTAAGIAPVGGAPERKSALAAAAGRVGRLAGRAAVTMRDARRCATSAAASPPPDARTLPVRARRTTAVAADGARAIELRPQLRRALRAAELVLAYEPQADPRTGDIRAAAALVRWRHADHGLLLPAAFMPVIAGHPLMRPLTLRVLEHALADARRWRAAAHSIRVPATASALCVERRRPVVDG